MYITYIELENVKSYESSGRINFAKGINAIGGQNGAGKSTILEAIGFALFDARTHTKENFIREGCKKGKIIVGFVDAVDERLYEVVREIPGTPYIYDPEIKRKKVNGKDDVYSWIKEHLQVSSAGDLEALFQDTIGVQQGLLTAPFQQTPRERKLKFDKLLQVEEYDDVYKWLAVSEKDLDKLITAEREKKASLQGKLSDLPDLQEKVKSLLKDIEETSEKLGKKVIEINEVHTKKLGLDETKGQIDTLMTDIKTQFARICDLEITLKKAIIDLADAEKAQEVIKGSLDNYETFRKCEAELNLLEDQRKDRDEQLTLSEKIKRDILENDIKTKASQEEMRKIQEAEAEIKRLTPILKEFYENQAALEIAENKDIQRQNIITRINEENERLKEFADKLKKVHNDLLYRSEIDSKITGLDSQLKTLNINRASEDAQKRLHKDQIEQLQERMSVLGETDTNECPVCLSPLGPEKITELESHFSKEIVGLEQKLGSSQKQLKDFDDKLKELESEQARYKDQLKRLPAHTREAEVRVEIKQQETVISEWEEKNNAFIGLDELLVQLLTKKNEFGDIVSQEAINQNIAGKRISVEKKLDDFLKLSIQFQTIKEDAALVLHAYVDLDEIIKSTKSNKENSRTGHDQYLSNLQIAQQLKTRTNRKDDIQNDLEENTKEYQSAQDNLKILQTSYDQIEHDQLIKRFDLLNNEHGGLQTKVEMFKQLQQETNNKVKDLVPLVQELNTREHELCQLNSVSAVLTFFRRMIREAGPYIVKQLLQAISEEADRIFGEILNDFTARLIWTEDYEITIEHQGYKREFSQLSGGEKMTAALAVRLALLREMSEIRIAFFDEPTANLDDERRSNLAEQMTKIKGFDQLFVISHDDTFEHQTDHVLHIYKENGSSHFAMGG